MFLSYARKDGEVFAGALRQRLAIEEPEITLWQDRTALEGGVGWWAQIEAALDQVTFLVLVMTPAALESKTTRQEWQAARQRGVKVYPVKGAPDDQIDYGRLPSWMRKAHFFDIGQFSDGRWRDPKEWLTFVNYLKSDPQRMRQPFMAPELHDFVPRRREIDQLLQLVLDPALQDPVAITTALQGAGGYGKTTLAMALCHDERVIEAFDDGVLWVSLGQTPQLLDELTKLYEALSGQARAFVDVAQASAMLAERLAHKHCLLVIDDVWNRAHLEPFLKGATQCARLVTTRRLDLLKGAPRVRVDEMSAAESVRLLGMAFPAGTVADVRLEPLARRLGEWPLLLKLAAGMIRARLTRGDSNDGALTYVNRALDRHGVTAFDSREPAQRDEAVRGTVSASLDQLTAEEGRRFRELAIFPEETAIPLTTLERLWGLDDLDTADCARRLDDVALLVLDLRRGVVSLHDVMRAYLLRELGDAAAVHARLVAGYGDPRRLPDLYAWRWLPTHMAHAGQTAPLRALLLQPDWLEAKIRAVGAPALIRDFDLTRGDTDLDLVQSALRLSLPALSADAGQLCEQLLGRLPRERSARIESFKQNLSRSGPQPRLRLRWPSLRQPGGRLLQTLSGHTDAVTGALLLADGRVLSWSIDGTMRVWDLSTGEQRILPIAGGSPVGAALLLRDDVVLSWHEDGTLRLLDLATDDARILSRHAVSVRGALALPDGKALSWGDDGMLRIWDTATGAELQLVGHTALVSSVVLLADGQALSSGEDGTVRAWNLTTGEGRVLSDHKEVVYGAIALSDGDRLMSFCRHGPHVLSLATGDTSRLTGHSDRVLGAREVAPGRVLAWCRDGTLALWTLDTGEMRALIGDELRPPIAGATGLAGERALSWGMDGTLRVWDLSTGDGYPLVGHDQSVSGALLVTDTRVLSWSADRTLRVWDLANEASDAAQAFESRIHGALRVDSGRALSWSRDEATVRSWDLVTGETRVLAGHTQRIEGVLRVSDALALSWSADKTLRSWDLSTGEGRVVASFELSIYNVAVLDGGRALSCSIDGTLRVWDLATGAGRTLSAHKNLVHGVLELPGGRALTWSGDGVLWLWDLKAYVGRTLFRHTGYPQTLLLPDGRVLSWSTKERTLQIWDPATGAGQALNGHQDLIYDAQSLPDGRVLSFGAAGSLWVWTLATGEGRALVGHQARVFGALSLEGERLLSWSADGTLRIWNRAGGEERVFAAHRGRIWRVLLLPDGRALSCSPDDDTPRVWNLATGEARDLIGHQGNLRGVHLLPDGRVLSWSHDRSVRIWNIDGDEPDLAFYLDATPKWVFPDSSDSSGDLLVCDALGSLHLIERTDRLPARHP